MSLLFDPQTGKITYHGKEVGEHRFDGHASTVRIALEYSTSGEWILPLSGLAYLPFDNSLVELTSTR